MNQSSKLDLSVPDSAGAPRCHRSLSAVVGATGTLLILASAAVCYMKFFRAPPADGTPDAFKAPLLIAVALFLSGACSPGSRTRLHGD